MFYSRVRVYLALVVTGAGLVISDVLMRFIIVPISRTWPERGHGILTKWARAMARLTTRPFQVFGVLSMEGPPNVPGSPGTLLVMNHQSLFDIPILLLAVQDNCPKIVTRHRYARGIPVVSQMTKVFGFPLVRVRGGKAALKQSLTEIRQAARQDDAPLAIFPEGSRSRDGEIGEFQTAGLRVILKARPWRVHVLVTDGCWRRADLKSLLSSSRKLRSRTEHAGVIDWDRPTDAIEPLMSEIQARMRRKLKAMRAGVT